MKLIFEEYFNNLNNWNFENGFVRIINYNIIQINLRKSYNTILGGK